MWISARRGLWPALFHPMVKRGSVRIFLVLILAVASATVLAATVHAGEHQFPYEFTGESQLPTTLNEVIVKATGQDNEINDTWLGVLQNRGISPPVVFRWVSLAFGALLVVLAAVGLWSWSLRRQVRRSTLQLSRELVEREEAEQALRESEERFSAISSSAKDAIIMMDHEGNVSFWNSSAQEMFGYASEEILGRDLHLALAPQESLASQIKTCLLFSTAATAPPEGQTIESKGRKKDGTEFPVELSLSYVKRKNRWNAIALLRDVTQRKHAEEDLLRSGERFRSLFENTPVPIWEEDFSRVKAYTDSLAEEYGGNLATYLEEHPEVVARCVELVKIVDVNQAAMSLHGAQEKHDLMENLGRVFIPQTYDAFRRALSALLSGETEMEIDTVEQTIAGQKRDLIVHWSVPPGHEKTLSRVLVSCMDITENRKIESQLRQAQKMEAIGTLAGGIAHDFNNILSAIIGYTELAQDTLSPENGSYKNLEEVLRASFRARDLVKQILTFSRQVEGEYKPVQVHLILTEALKLLRSSIPSTIKIEDQVDRNSGMVIADPSQIHQLIMNLCTNAYQAMEETGGIMRVTLERTMIDSTLTSEFHQLHEGPYMKLSVSDTGRGMDESTAERIFDPFFTTREKARGTGLGLATVHGIVTNLGGHIHVDSSPGKGSSFTVYLPCSGIEPPHEPASTEGFPGGQGERILMVDDEASIAQIEKQMLEDLGYIVTSKTESTDAFETFRRQPAQFDLVITDMTMPNLTGVDLSRKILQLRPDIPIILCTGFSDHVDRDRAHQLGIRAYLEKPFDKASFAQTIRRVLDEAV